MSYDLLSPEFSLLMKKEIVFDIGAHGGDDCSVYLELGYRVVAVEANPKLIIDLKERFRKEIEAEDLVVLNYAIANKDNELMDFFINEDSSKSSVREIAQVKPIKVISQRLQTILQHYGNPFYCKIDIEGSDLVALESLGVKLPTYISAEVSGRSISEIQLVPEYLFETINCLYAKGYKQFKLVDQEHLVVLSTNSYYKKKKTLSGRLKTRVEKKLRISPRDKFRRRFKLAPDSEVSGYPGNQISGVWLTYEEARELLHFHFQEFCMICENQDFIFWVDVHAFVGGQEFVDRV